MASTNSNNITYTINVGGNATTVFKQINESVNAVTESTKKSISAFEKWGENAILLNNILDLSKRAISAISGAVGSWENAYKAQASAETKLAQVMRNTMEASNAEIESIKQLANAQQKLGIVSRSVQLAGAQELGTYLEKSESLKELMPVMNDMIAQQYGYNATQEQATQIASMMGKVMDGQVGALSRYGYKFTEAQEQILKYGTEAQRAATLAEVVTSAVGGMNEAMAQTPEGRLKQQADAMNNIAVQAGKVYVNVKAALLPMFEWVAQKLENLVGWFENNLDKISAICRGIAKGIAMAFDVVFAILGFVVNVFKWLWNVISAGLPIVAGLAAAVGAYALVVNAAAIKTGLLAIGTKGLAVIQGVATGITKLWTVAQWALNAAMTANPIGAVVALIAGLIAAVVVCWQKFAGFRAFIKTMWDTMKGFGNIIKEFVIDRIKGLIAGVGAIGEAFMKLFKGDFRGAWQSAKTGVVQISGIDSAKKAVNSTRELAGGMRGNYNERLTAERSKKAEKNKEKDASSDEFNTDAALASLPTVNSPVIGDAVSGIGGRAGADNAGKIKNINVVIERVVDNFTVTTNNLKEDASKIKQMVADALIGAVNDLNYAVS